MPFAPTELDAGHETLLPVPTLLFHSPETWLRKSVKMYVVPRLENRRYYKNQSEVLWSATLPGDEDVDEYGDSGEAEH